MNILRFISPGFQRFLLRERHRFWPGSGHKESILSVCSWPHDLPDVTVRPRPESDSSRSRNIEANPAASSLNGGQGVLPVLAVEGALGRGRPGSRAPWAVMRPVA